MPKSIAEFAAEALAQANWALIDSRTDEELDEIVRNDPDDVFLTDEDFEQIAREREEKRARLAARPPAVVKPAAE